MHAHVDATKLNEHRELWCACIYIYYSEYQQVHTSIPIFAGTVLNNWHLIHVHVLLHVLALYMCREFKQCACMKAGIPPKSIGMQ